MGKGKGTRTRPPLAQRLKVPLLSRLKEPLLSRLGPRAIRVGGPAPRRDPPSTPLSSRSATPSLTNTEPVLLARLGLTSSSRKAYPPTTRTSSTLPSKRKCARLTASIDCVTPPCRADSQPQPALAVGPLANELGPRTPKMTPTSSTDPRASGSTLSSSLGASETRLTRRSSPPLLNATSRPQFPDEEWGNILSGRVVDLDRVLSSIFGHATPSKTVKTYGDWVTAWSATSEAVLFILPHLKADLDAYAKHIQAYFRSLPSEGIYPQRVINDFFAFSDLQLMWIHGPMVPDAPRPSGGNSGRSRRADGRPDARVRDPCNRWNAGSCPNSTSSCKYAHVCRKCRSNRHAEGSCTASD
ncbi:hypothetical protein BD626DRAFT_498363 [Schizophyllum amplum]|uniref:C3H1-type domain-containing protein n=1 Tax=Schizophyllum amplum TaxID=97359 RepID=A0A550CDA6_9AGAR|nr:hypothetical protein BD626DRAFT_498363 [Auriculariopsis ampla]